MPAPLAFPREVLRPTPVERPKTVGLPPTEATPPGEFAERVREFVGTTNDTQVSANTQVEAFAEGRSHDLHGTMIAMEHATIQLKLFGTVRNKVIEAYREVMRMGA